MKVRFLPRDDVEDDVVGVVDLSMDPPRRFVSFFSSVKGMKSLLSPRGFASCVADLVGGGGSLPRQGVKDDVQCALEGMLCG